MRTTRNVLLASCLLVLAGACASGTDSDWQQSPFAVPNITPGPVGGGFKRVVPTDERPAQIADKPPVAVTGGTLIVTGDGKYAIAADPDRDRVSVVDIATTSLVRTIALEPGDEPGRLAEDDQGRVHVALRRAGAVADIDIATGQVLDRRAACAAPRGIAFDAVERTLRVACASGELVTLLADGGGVIERLALDTDLRDVVITQDGLRISRFKRAELLSLPNGAHELSSRMRPVERQTTFAEATTGALVVDTLEPEIVWRTVSDLKGGVVMLHQGARKGEIPLPEPDSDDSDNGNGATTSGAAGGGAFGIGGSAYGGGGSCDGVVQSELTRVDAAGVASTTMRFDAVLAVDIAVAPVSGTIAVAQAGEHDFEQPLPSFVEDGGGSVTMGAAGGRAGPFGSGSGTVMAFLPDAMVGLDPQQCAFPTNGASVAGQPTAVAFTADDTLVVQSREPAQISILRNFGSFDGDPGQLTVDLGGGSVYDTGHELFHRDAGARIACASCHAEGGDDGHVWHFASVGPRRTQSVNVGLEGTAPFHWSGDQADVSALMEDVFVNRMGGVHETQERTHALEGWLFALSPLPAQRTADDKAALRGQALFEGEGQCNSCHNGQKLTNNKTVDVGTGEPLQVPSLRGVGYRAPLIHNGCAATLRDRFDPACGGDKHGKTAQLSTAQVDDLVAYLQTL